MRDVYVGALRNNLPAFTLFNQGLSWAESELTAEILEDARKIEDAKAGLASAETPREQARFGMLLGRLEREKADKEQGMKLFKAALEKTKVYHILGEEERPSIPKVKVR